jgi:hypothetical protein
MPTATASLPKAWAPCRGDLRSKSPALVTDVNGKEHEIRRGAYVFLDTPGPDGKMRMGLGIGGQLLAKKKDRLLIRFYDGTEVWAPFVSKFQLDDYRDDEAA